MSAPTQEQVEAVFKECLRHYAGANCPNDWNPNDDVIECCTLDSLHGVELACDLVSQLDIDIPLKDNPLVEDNGEGGRRRSRSYSEVIRYLMGLLKK